MSELLPILSLLVSKVLILLLIKNRLVPMQIMKLSLTVLQATASENYFFRNKLMCSYTKQLNEIPYARAPIYQDAT